MLQAVSVRLWISQSISDEWQQSSFSKEIGSGDVQGHNQVPYSDNKREFYEWMQLLEKFDTLLRTLVQT